MSLKENVLMRSTILEINFELLGFSSINSKMRIRNNTDGVIGGELSVKISGEFQTASFGW